MKMIATKILTTNEPSFIERATRTAVGVALIGSVFVAGETPLGWLALLPLLGIYPLYSGLTGSSSLHSLSATMPTAYRLASCAASAALVGSVFVISAVPLGAYVILPLAGIYVALCALLGSSPLAAVVEAHASLPYIVPPVAEPSDTSRASQRAISQAA